MTDTSPTPDTREVVLSLRGISKHFGAVSALTDIDLDVHAGEVVALGGLHMRDHQSLCAGARRHMLDESFHGGVSVAFPLVRAIDHQAPEKKVWLVGMLDQRRVVQHHESHGLLAGIDCAKPGFPLEIRLRDRYGVEPGGN